MDTSLDDFFSIFNSLEYLTDSLIDELVNVRKIPRADLLSMRSMGFQYSRSRNSFFSPLEFD